MRDLASSTLVQGATLFSIQLELMPTVSLHYPAAKEDKRRAIMTLPRDPEWDKWSDRQIAQRCQVYHNTVGTLRAIGLAIYPVTLLYNLSLTIYRTNRFFKLSTALSQR